MGKKVYVAMSADILHISHLNIIKEACCNKYFHSIQDVKGN